MDAEIDFLCKLDVPNRPGTFHKGTRFNNSGTGGVIRIKYQTKLLHRMHYKTFNGHLLALCVMALSAFHAQGEPARKASGNADDQTARPRQYVATKAYRWVDDSIIQGPFKAYAPDPHKIVSDYYAQPGFRMPVEQEWTLKNDISIYPELITPNKLHEAIFNMGLDEMVNAVEPDLTLRTGKEWPGVWTRDVSYSIILAMAALQPEASRISLERKINENGRIVQDTGSGGAWPISTDRQIWSIAAYELYKTTGDKEWLRKIYPVIKNSLEDDYKTVYDPATGLVRGETSFIDWREQSYPRWMQMSDIAQSEALNTSVVHAQAWSVLAEMAYALGEPAEARKFEARAQALSDAINSQLWMDDKGYYAMYRYGRDYPILNPRAETLGESLAILFGVASPNRSRLITEKNPTTPFGTAIFYPQIADMPAYHNNALWPWVAAYWTLANAKVGNEEGVMQGIGSIFRPAALFATNKENFNLDNGDIATELNSSNMLWCLSGNLAVTMKVLFGINYEPDGIEFRPFVPKVLGDSRSLNGLHYRNATLNISITGYGSKIAHFYLNGKEHAPFIPGDITGENNIRIVMADNNPEQMRINEVDNLKAPLTPIAWLANDPSVDAPLGPVNNLLQWNPIEWVDHYNIIRDGKVIGQTNETSWLATTPGEYQVIAVNSNGTESFASEPRSNAQTILADFPNEGVTIESDEACNVGRAPLHGYRGQGFCELDHKAGSATVNVNVPEGGVYAIQLRYANGNGVLNTENKAAVRTLLVDGKRAGTVVMPQRGAGNWNDWGLSNVVETRLTPGHHRLTLVFLPENENMNLRTNHALADQFVLRRLRP